MSAHSFTDIEYRALMDAIEWATNKIETGDPNIHWGDRNALAADEFEAKRTKLRDCPFLDPNERIAVKALESARDKIARAWRQP